MNNVKYDYIVIGSATGGVVASRLAEAGHFVLLIEAGPNDETFSCTNCNAYPFGDMKNGTINIPNAMWWFNKVSALKWHNVTAMPSYWNYNRTRLHSRRESVYRAKMLGGCLSHNGHAWMRGDIRDYDFVSQSNNLPDWSFNSVLPYYQKIETYLGENKTMRGLNGPIEIIQRNIQPFEHKLKAIFDTAINYGLPYNSYQNGVGSRYGVALGEANIGKYKNGKFGLFNTTFFRESSSQSYIRNIGMKTGFLTVWDNTTVQKILFDHSKKTTNQIPNAIGVQYWDPNDGILKSVHCKKEIILSAGLYQSPQLLILSGIGPLKQLNKLNIKPIGHVASHEYIGKNGQDHAYLPRWRYKLNLQMLNTEFKAKPPKGVLINKYFQKEKEKEEYVTFYNRGRIELVLSSNKFNRLGYDYNDISLSCFDGHPKSREIECYIDSAVYSKNLSMEVNSNDSRIYPTVYNNFFSDSRDYDRMIEAIYKFREIFAHNKSVFVKETYPGIDKTEEELRDIIFNDVASSIHGVGTVSMGDNNNIYSNEYPLSSKCLLRGVNKLRVADLSIWPYSPSGGTQALAFMIGEKCAKHIIDDYVININDVMPVVDDTETQLFQYSTRNDGFLLLGIIFIFAVIWYKFLYKYKGKRGHGSYMLFILTAVFLNWLLITRLVVG